MVGPVRETELMVVFMQSEEEKLSILVDREKEEISMLQCVLTAVENIETLHQSKDLDLARAKEEFSKLREQFPQEYRFAQLSSHFCSCFGHYI